MNVRFDAPHIMNIAYRYLYDEIDGRDPEIFDIVERLVNDELQDLYEYNIELVLKILRGWQPAEDFEEEKKIQKDFKKIKREDIGYISAKFGFLYGLVCAEKLRLKFKVPENEIY